MRGLILVVLAVLLAGCAKEKIYVNHYIVLEPPVGLLERFVVPPPIDLTVYDDLRLCGPSEGFVEQYLSVLNETKEQWIERHSMAIRHNRMVDAVENWILLQKQSYQEK